MKLRKGFVSNSSTTSFTCEVCGETWAGSDSLSYADTGFFHCMNGHVLCEAHKLDAPDLTNQEMYDILVEYYKDFKSYASDLEAVDRENVEESWLWEDLVTDSGVSEIYCPVCQFYEISNDDTAAYLLKATGVPREEAFAWVKERNRRRKKLYDSEYIMYVQMTQKLDISMLASQLKDMFGTYKKFQEWLSEK
jgi:hypothetical protein